MTDMLEKVARALKTALAYDAAIRDCANNPEKMATHCTAEGDSLDDLYDNWISAAHEAQAVLDAIGESCVVVPAGMLGPKNDSGYVVVPREPTEEMVNAAWDTSDLVYEKADGSYWIRWADVSRTYKAMLSASQETIDG